MKCWLAIDIGASSGRHIAAWMEDGAMRMREVYRFQNGVVQRAGHLCWDMDALVLHVKAGLRAAGQKGYEPVALGIDTWAVDFVLLDGENRPVGDLVAYRDGRTRGMDALLEQTLPFEEHYAVTGVAKQPFNTVYQMMAVLREHPSYREQARDFLMVPEYLAYRLTGQKRHEWTNCSTTALCDAVKKTWSERVIDAARLPRHWFEGEIAQPGERLGGLLASVQAEVGFDAQVILTATHDTGSAYLATPVRDAHAAILSSGTWSLLGTELAAPCTTRASMAAGFTNEGGYGGTTRYLKNIMGLWMLQRIREECSRAHTFAEMAEMAARSTYPAWVDAMDQRFLAPQRMTDEVKAALAEQGAPEPQGLGDLLRAVHVGLAVCYRDAVAQMSRLTGKTFTSIHVVGGGSRNETLNAMTAKLTGLPVIAGPAEGTAIGNLMVQMLSMGVFASVREAREAIQSSEEVI